MHLNTIKFLLFAALFCFVACNKNTEAPASPEVASVMIYNGSTDFAKKPSPVYVDTSFLTFRGYNGIDGGALGLLTNANYSWVDPGKHRIGFADTSGKEQISQRYEVLDKNKWYTFYLTDSVGYSTILMSEENIADRPADKARIRLVHLAPDCGLINFMIDKEKVTGLQNIAYKTITPFIEVAPVQNPSFRIMRWDAKEEDPQLVRKTFALLPGRSYTFIVRGYMAEQNGDPNTTIDLSAIQNF